MGSEPVRIMFVYWGRRGLTSWAYEIAAQALSDPRFSAAVSVSRQNEAFPDFVALDPRLLAVDTFSRSHGALTQAWRIEPLRKRIVERVRRDRIEAVIEIIPHVWSPFIMPAVRQAGARYVTIQHDSAPHAGDYRSRIARRVFETARHQADLVLTLSQAVADDLSADPEVARKTITLFLPDVGLSRVRSGERNLQPPGPHVPLRLLWLGRIMPYKGLPLFVEAVEKLRARGVDVEVGVFGEGLLGDSGDRLKATGVRCEINNRWHSHSEVAALLSRFHVAVLSHTGASQSGVVSTALGAGLPVIVTPVGGLPEQVEHGVTGLVARRADSDALADAIANLKGDPALYQNLLKGIYDGRNDRSIVRFLEECVGYALPGRLDRNAAGPE